MNTQHDKSEFTGSLVRSPWFYRQWMLAGNPAYFFDRLVNDFGDFVHYRGLFSFYLVNHPALVKQVLMETHKSFDIAQEMNQLTLEVAGRALFHDGFDAAHEKISEWTGVINRYSAKPPMPISGKLWFPTRTNRRLKVAMKEFYEFLREMIEQRSHESTQQRVLLSVLLNISHEETGQPMSDDEVIEEVLGMIIGGHETSSAALTWTWYELYRNPQWEARLHEELETVLAGRRPTLDDFPKLKATKIILDETMRLHPPFWFENRNVNTDQALKGRYNSKSPNRPLVPSLQDSRFFWPRYRWFHHRLGLYLPFRHEEKHRLQSSLAQLS